MAETTEADCQVDGRPGEPDIVNPNHTMTETLAENAGAKLEFLQGSSLGMDSDALLTSLTHYYTRMLGRRTVRTDTPFLYQALVHATRD
ncbi:MAG TPA: hypothetical protein VJN01_12900, partial [Xanthomonadales bacterium]|nr:hypothetical protein [Xanthomonadales bacterium]